MRLMEEEKETNYCPAVGCQVIKTSIEQGKACNTWNKRSTNN
ncbi:hypothetical protein BVRB_2g037450 [Beta vulgaris subsp. vulgaris]|nr:hypothetical protein BVRB_2g037450 [Beta vulgaris subsp. vulgaris]